jgi:hypothetical protein
VKFKGKLSLINLIIIKANRQIFVFYNLTFIIISNQQIRHPKVVVVTTTGDR